MALNEADKAAHIHGILHNIETRLFELKAEQVGRDAADDDETANAPGATFKARRSDLEAQASRIKKEYKDLLPEVEAIAAARDANVAADKAARAAAAAA
jgi:uncharacterized protein involved in exopolysaccharide biosynthesis